jgi:hypothetical protein
MTPLVAVGEAANILVESFSQFSRLGMGPEGEGEEKALAHSIPDEQYNILVEKLELSARTLNCLKRSKINKVGEVLELGTEGLLKIKNFGEKSLVELYERLESVGITPPGVPDQIEDGGDATVTEEASGQLPAEPTFAEDAPIDLRPGQTLRDLSALRALIGTADEGNGQEGDEEVEAPTAAEEDDPES